MMLAPKRTNVSPAADCLVENKTKEKVNVGSVIRLTVTALSAVSVIIVFTHQTAAETIKVAINQPTGNTVLFVSLSLDSLSAAHSNVTGNKFLF